METSTAPATETRPYSLAELSRLVSLFREAWGWSQETLAEISGLTVRTIQRVEAGAPSCLDTRRAIARAFQLDDMDTFSKAHEIATPEGVARAKAEFDRKYMSLEVRPLDGRALVKALAASGPYRVMQSGGIGHLPREAEDLYAEIVDFLSDLLDALDFAGQVEILKYGDEVEAWITGMRAQGFEVGLGVRKVRIGRGGLPAELSYVMALPAGGRLRHVAVEREPEPGTI